MVVTMLAMVVTSIRGRQLTHTHTCTHTMDVEGVEKITLLLGTCKPYTDIMCLGLIYLQEGVYQVSVAEYGYNTVCSVRCLAVQYNAMDHRLTLESDIRSKQIISMNKIKTLPFGLAEPG